VTEAIAGIDGAPVSWVITQGLAAAVSNVPAEDFEEEPLNAHVRDMAWLGPRAVAHQAVNAQLFEAADACLPLTFGTVFRDDERVRQLLSRQSTELDARLAKVRDCAEWVVALHLLRQPTEADVVAASPALQSLRSQIADSAPGRAHLLRRQLATLTRDEARRIQYDAASDVLDMLREVATDIYREPLPQDAVDKPLLRASLLVRRLDETSLMDTMDRLRHRWPEPTYRLLVTGPWPAYRFGGLSDGA
jgi:hypothetical protein